MNKQIASHAMFAAAVMVNIVGGVVGMVDGDWQAASWRACSLAFVLGLWIGTEYLRRMMVARAEFYRTQVTLLERMIDGRIAAAAVELGDELGDSTRH
jgi:uncharacterized MAPEG superfamily protein